MTCAPSLVRPGFKSELRGASPTDNRWRSFSRGKPGIPSVGVLNDHGGLAELVRQASHPDWEKQAGTGSTHAYQATTHGPPSKQSASAPER